MPPKSNEYITLYDLRGPWVDESSKEIILRQINTKIDTLLTEKDKQREEAVAEAVKEEKKRCLAYISEQPDHTASQRLMKRHLKEIINNPPTRELLS